ncbi:hypothetical protein [Polymorphobacter multimanifer]|uniref:hypothetical protein n=1 Tax=Polymorphobacter multimanifer TaxID=1070431 RepID=UPI001666C405|nr:hypothetical protein [Polymorphobacter multimanifer]
MNGIRCAARRQNSGAILRLAQARPAGRARLLRPNPSDGAGFARALAQRGDKIAALFCDSRKHAPSDGAGFARALFFLPSLPLASPSHAARRTRRKERGQSLRRRRTSSVSEAARLAGRV